MRYGVTDDTCHNNMVPFFGSRNGYGHNEGQEKKLTDFVQRKVDLYSGSINNPDYKHKEEVKPLFSPLMGFTNIYGQQVMSDFYQSRYIPGRERRNEYPVQQIRVTPGLNLGYSEVSYQGYVDPYRPHIRNVDELRYLSKPKLSFKGTIIPGQMGDRQPVASEVFKHRPEKLMTLKHNLFSVISIQLILLLLIVVLMIVEEEEILAFHLKILLHIFIRN
jgi:hypothetical protein